MLCWLLSLLEYCVLSFKNLKTYLIRAYFKLFFVYKNPDKFLLTCYHSIVNVSFNANKDYGKHEMFIPTLIFNYVIFIFITIICNF